MTKRILIDAMHNEEIRMVVLEDGKVLDYDVQTQDKTQNRGNIYVGVVNRVEPSLQSAFVEYGGNRNGFLPMSEVNPNFYEKLSEKEYNEVLQEAHLNRSEKYEFIRQAREMLAMAEAGHVFEIEEDQPTKTVKKRKPKKVEKIEDTKQKLTDKSTKELIHKTAENNKAEQIEFDFAEGKKSETATEQTSRAKLKTTTKTKKSVKKVVKTVDLKTEDKAIVAETVTAEFGDPKGGIDVAKLVIPEQEVQEEESKELKSEDITVNLEIGEQVEETLDENLELKGEKDVEVNSAKKYIKLKTKTNEEQIEELKGLLLPLNRRYNIADVLKVGQKVLVQVNKEERGNKGAALTTNISLPGRYSVLMPNVANAGGVSRKITDHVERSELRNHVDALDVAKEMSLIVRTAAIGQSLTALERDYSALKIQWENILNVLAKENGAVCVHNDSNIITKAIRDIVSADVDEIVISGDVAYKEAKAYVKAIMPSYSKQVREHRAQTPIFSHYKVETELHKLHTTRVDLESGAYLIINPTEALVSIDINSGKATGEKNIEDTALKINIESAQEIAKQLRLRDLSGLIVIDFIDMDKEDHERQVERALRNALRNDRARTQVGYISEFGLLEMSRQRIRPTLEESMFKVCPHCCGTGHVRSPASSALTILRGIEEEKLFTKADILEIYTHSDVAVYMLNYKRDMIKEFETRYKVRIVVKADHNYLAPDHKVVLLRVNADGSVKKSSQEFILREKAEDLNQVDSEIISSFVKTNQVKTVDTRVTVPFEVEEELEKSETKEVKTQAQRELKGSSLQKASKMKSAFKRWWSGR